MGSILERPRADGTIAYLAKIAIMREGRIVHRESRTFDRRPAAVTWIDKRERDLAKPGALDAAQADNPTLAMAIDRYISTSRKKIGKTKAQVLQTVKGMDIAQMRCSEIKSHHLVELAETLQTGRQPQTVGNYMSHLGAVFSIAKHAWAMDLDASEMQGAAKVSKRLGLTSKSKQRDRRPTLEELDRLMTHFGVVEMRRAGSTPMQKIIAFAIFSTRRQEEITTIRWADLEADRVLVRDMKHPGEKIGNDTWVDLVPEARRVIDAMPKRRNEVFPVSTDAISAGFTRACQVLGIEDLRFHDLRHEGVSRLFEMGWNIPHVAAVSGHRSWQSLKRYTHLRQTGDKYANWKWLGTSIVRGPNQ
jgi:integrase